MSDSLNCHHCGEPIGVYEPLVTFMDGRPRETSRAAEGHPGRLRDACFHRACFELTHDELALPA
jgi:hypothetical protein